VTYCPAGKPEQRVQLEAVVLAALCPASDGLARWIAVDLDGPDHGPGGLADPMHAERCIAERAGGAGLAGGSLCARSRNGKGAHFWLLAPEPVPLADAVVVAAALAAQAWKAAGADAEHEGAPHAFRSVAGRIVVPGKSGAVELIPPSTDKPRLGWSMTLPLAGALAYSGGGLLFDPFKNEPARLEKMPATDPDAWETFLRESRAELARRTRPARPRPQLPRRRTRPERDPLTRIDSRTRDLLDGRIPEGERNKSVFAGVCNLIGCGVQPTEAERLALAGALACGLHEREARSAIKSALRRAVK